MDRSVDRSVSGISGTRRAVRLRRTLVSGLAALSLVGGVTTAVLASSPGSGTITDTATEVTWTGTPPKNVNGRPAEDCADPVSCDVFALSVALPSTYWDTRSGALTVRIDWDVAADDFDLYVFDSTGAIVKQSTQAGTTFEEVTLPTVANGDYEVRVIAFTTDPTGTTGGTFNGRATLVAAVPPPAFTGTFYFHGELSDEASKTAGFPTAYFDETAPVSGDLDVTQTTQLIANANTAGDRTAAFWTGSYSGPIDTDIEIDWYWSSPNPDASTVQGSDVVVRFFADADNGTSAASKVIGSASVPLTVGPYGVPARNLSRVHVTGSVASKLTIQVTPVYVNTGAGLYVHYNSPSTPSRFREAPPINQTPVGIDGLPSVDAQGLAFSATVPADNQRDESEPIIDTDLDGNIISCGPSGSSQAAEYASISTDGGDQFHLLGTPPRGQMGSGGGGDCSWAFAPEKSGDRYPFAYTGLGPLTNFTASMSTDGGRTISTAPISGETLPGVDRQWSVFLNETDVLLSYNQQAPRQVVVQKATDGGINYGPRVPATPTDPSFPGPLRTLPAAFNPTGSGNGRVPYFSWNSDAQINFSISFDEGATWSTCTVAQSLGSPALFTTADNDIDGNIYVAYGEQASFHTFITYLTVDKIADCNEPVTELRSAMPAVNPGWATPIQVDRDAVRTTIFPWMVASGDPGHVAVAFYGTETEGNPNSPSFQASWDVYVAQSLNLLDADPTFAQVKATTHPFHYDSICLEGLGCSISGGDRSLADFFAIDLDPARNALVIAYDQGSKRPGDVEGSVATPAVVRQVAGPAMIGTGTIDIPDRTPLRTGSADPAGDALAGYSTLGSTPLPLTNLDAMDFTSVTVGAQLDLTTEEYVANGGFTVEFDVADLSTDALNAALTALPAQSLLWIFRIVDGYRASAVGLTYSAAGFGAGYSEYTTDRSECGGTGTGGKCVQYPLDQPVQFDVDQSTGHVRLSVPRAYLSALSPQPSEAGSYGHRQVPDEVGATVGTRIFDATMFSLGNTVSATQLTQGFLYPLDNTPAFDFLIEPPGTTLIVNDPDVAESDTGTNLAFTVTMTPPSPDPITLTWSTGEDTNGVSPASAGVDYTAVTGAVEVIPAGTATYELAVPVVGDDFQEPDETLLVHLDAVDRGHIRRGTGRGTILNDDIPDVARVVTVAGASVSEGDPGDAVAATADFEVTLDVAPGAGESVVVHFETADIGAAVAGADYTATAGDVTFAEGETAKTISVPIVGDELDEFDESFEVRLTADGAALSHDAAVGAILDDDPEPSVSIGDAAVSEGDTGTTTLSFEVSLDAPSGKQVSVPWATSDTGPDDTATSGQDYTSGSGDASFAPGVTLTSVEVQVVPDADVEDDEVFHVLLTGAPTNAVLADASARGTIVNDDTAPVPSASPSPGASPSPDPTPQDTTTRIAGPTRFDTAAAMSRYMFPEDHAASSIVIARGDGFDGFPDAIAGIPLAHKLQAPMLLTFSYDLPDATRTELVRVLRPSGTVYLLGGPRSVSREIENEIIGLGYRVRRIYGTDRVNTSIAVAEEIGNPDVLMITSGDLFADAMGAGTAAAHIGGALLLTHSEVRNADIDAYLAEHPDATLMAIGGPAARPYPEATPIVGEGRVETAALVASRFFDQPTHVGIARLDLFPDALTGGAPMSALGGPILLSDTQHLSPATAAYLCTNADAITDALAFGGVISLADAVLDAINERIQGIGCA